MDSKSIRYFETVYEEQGISQAAKQLFISPQGLSHVINNLEKELNTTLFLRTPKGMIPTKSADYFYSQSKQILNLLEQTAFGIREIDSQTKTLRIGFANGTIHIFTPDQVLSGVRTMTGIRTDWVELMNDEVKSGLLSGKIHIGFLTGPVIHPNLVVHKLFECNVNAIVYKGHPFFNKDSLSMEDLKNEPLICLNEKFSIYHSLIRRCSDFDFVPNITIKTLDSRLICRFCKEKLGIGIDVDIHKDLSLPDTLKCIPITDASPWRISAAKLRTGKDEEKELTDQIFEQIKALSLAPSDHI